MEAVPKLPMISFDLKVTTEKTHFGPKLKQYIAEAYREDPDSYNNEIHQLEGLRATAVRPSIDSSGLQSLMKYFCQLKAMQSRFPMAKGQPAACSFVWKDLFANMTCSVPDLRFEMACILYNIGALHTQLAASEPRTSADSLKAACTHYQNAAWAFIHLREQYTQAPGVDVGSDIMRFLQEVCYAQAQECILDKSIQDTRKPSVIGAVATQVAHFYRNALALLGPSTGTDNIHEIIGTKLYNYWHRYLSFKTSYNGCIVCLYQGLNAEEQQKMGERVAFYQYAVDKLNEARKLVKYIEPVQITQEALTFTNDVVEGKRKAAKNENEFIYHEEVPDKDLLTELKPVCLVKAIPINLTDPEVMTDVFSRLVPMRAHEASSMYSEEKAKLLRQVVAQTDAKNTELTEFMSSLQLDQLEVLDSDHKVPQEIVDRCAAMNAKTEIIQSLVDSMNNLAEIISDVEHSLADIKTLIHEETLKEKDYQKIMGPRPPSIVQTELSREYHKYHEAHLRTNESNQVLHKAMTLHIANLRLLAQPLDVLQNKIPSVDNIEGLDRETMMEMRRVVGKAREMQTQRDSLVQHLREAVTADDITAQLLARSNESTDEIFKQELEKHTPKVKIIEQNLAAQENIINKLTSLYAAYGESRRLLSDVLRKRDGLINALVTSYDSYEELFNKSQKGLEFYKKLSHNVNQLLSRLRSTCQVQEEERQQHLAKQTTKAPAPAPPTSSRQADSSSVPQASGGGTLKLKDYLPYMKNRGAMPRSVTPQAQMDPMPPDAYYPETIYPTSIRPTPVGSEATDPTQMKLPDGVVMPQMQTPQIPYSRYSTPYSTNEPYSANYNYPASNKSDDSNYGYSTYTPPPFSSQAVEPQYANPYYSATHANPTVVTDSSLPNVNQANVNANVNQPNVNASINQPNPSVNQYNASPQASVSGAQYSPNVYGQYAAHSAHGGHMGAIPEAASTYSTVNQSELNMNFAQMQISGPKPDNYAGEYSQAMYNAQYPQSSTLNTATYNQAPHNSHMSLVPSQVPSDYSSNYPYANDMTMQNQYGQNPTSHSYQGNQIGLNQPQYGEQSTANQNPNYTMPDQSYSYPGTTYDPMSQGYTIYTNADSIMTSTTSVPNMAQVTPASLDDPYKFSKESNPNLTAALSQLDAMDKPIQSHAEALSTNMYPTNYAYDPSAGYSNSPDQNAANFNSQSQQNVQTANQNYTVNYAAADQPNMNYSQGYQNHPGYTYNAGSGSYDYNYGSQNSFSAQNAGQGGVQPVSGQNPNWPGVYTSAGACETVQSPSEMPQALQTDANGQIYYNSPYGYQTTTNQSSEVVPAVMPVSTNYGADMNQSTYMQSGQQDTSVTFSSSQVSTPKENVIDPPNFHENAGNTSETQQPPEDIKEVPEQETPSIPEVKPLDKEPEPTAFDLLSDIDFSVEQKPLMPEIKVPQISESAMKKPVTMPKMEAPPKPVVKEEVIERPAKIDIFSGPSLLNKFTQEVKSLQTLVDSLTNKTVGGVTVLDAKWKSFQDTQSKENMSRSKSAAMQHSKGNIVTEVVPYDDSRLKLKSDPDVYINASYYKQLASWCIPLVISKSPAEGEFSSFWKAVVENKIACVVCLLSEIEMQGVTYWPTAIGQGLELPGDVRVSLDEVNCTVHWTERKLTVATGKTVHNVAHYQINVFPAKIVCSPLVLLVDKILGGTFDNRLSNQLCGAWIHCGAGAGRSSVVALLMMAMCQVRAGQLNLCEMIDSGCVNLYKHRTNVLEDTKYLADAYRSVLFYVQGVLCSGTTMFNGEAVSLQSGAAVLPPVTPTSTATSSSPQKHKFSKESFEEMKQSPGLKSGDMKDPLNFLDPLWSLKKK